MTPRVRGAVTRRLPDALLVAALLAGGTAIGYFGRHWSFFYDEWGTILYRRSGGFSAFFAPHNGHLQAALIAVYRLLFATTGLRSYHPYQAVMILAHLTLVGLVYLYAKPRVGPWAAILLALPILLLAYAWQVIFWTINLGFVFPMIALVALLLWPHPLITGIAVGVALASSGLGVAVAVGALVLAMAREDRIRQLIAWAIPAAGYAVWWLAYRPSALPPASLRHIAGASPNGDIGAIHFPLANVDRTPSYVLHSAKATANALIGTGRDGWWMIVALTLVIVAALCFRRRLTVQAVALAAIALVFWIELALTRAQTGSPESFDASRYLYPGAVLLVLLLVEAFDGVHVPWPALAGLAVGIAVVMASDLGELRRLSGDVRSAFGTEASMLRRARCTPHLPPTLTLDPAQAPGVTVGPYLAAVRALGWPPGQAC